MERRLETKQMRTFSFLSHAEVRRAWSLQSVTALKTHPVKESCQEGCQCRMTNSNLLCGTFFGSFTLAPN